jgi:hypothetical protein
LSLLQNALKPLVALSLDPDSERGALYSVRTASHLRWPTCIHAGPVRRFSVDSLKDFDLARAGNLVTVQWRGSPKLSVGVLSTITEAEAFERVATLIESGGPRPGFDATQIAACVREIRLRAKRVELVDMARPMEDRVAAATTDSTNDASQLE